MDKSKVVLTDLNLDRLIFRCQMVDKEKYLVEKPVSVRRFPFLGFKVVFRRKDKGDG